MEAANAEAIEATQQEKKSESCGGSDFDVFFHKFRPTKLSNFWYVIILAMRSLQNHFQTRLGMLSRPKAHKLFKKLLRNS